MYFRNKKCPGCKGFDKIWKRFIKEFDKSFGKLCIVQCTEFFYDCKAKDASDTFIFYLVFATPQVILTIIENGEPVYIEREYIFNSVEELKNFVYGVYERRKAYESQPHEEESGEGLYIDLSSKNWKEIVEKIKKLIFEGRNIREVCDEEGCKLIVE